MRSGVKFLLYHTPHFLCCSSSLDNSASTNPGLRLAESASLKPWLVKHRAPDGARDF